MATGSYVQHRHTDLWFEDGNIILFAEGMGFKVHRGVLARHSAVFKDLFTLGSPSVDETLDGVPLVSLHDPPHELAALLDVIYNGSNFFGQTQQRHSFFVIQSLLRLGTKYQIEGLRNQALRYLEQILPGELTLWDQVEKDPPVDCSPADIIAIVNLTSELDLGPLHLRALYKCCQLPAHALVCGAPHAHGRAQLAPAHTVACLDGRTQLARCKQRMMEDMTWFWDQGLCEGEGRECRALQRALARRRHSAMWRLDAHPLQPLAAWLQDVNPGEVFGSRLCAQCKDRQAKFIQTRRIRIFARLKECFDTPTAEQDPASPTSFFL